MEQEILVLTKAYFKLMDEDISDDFLLLIVESVIDHYKSLRNYPSSFTDEMINADVNKYFRLRKNYIAGQVIPEVYGRIGAEGLSMLTDAGTSRFWAKNTLLNDVTPYCEVV